MLPSDYTEKWTKTEQGQTTIQKGYSVILWACLVSKRNFTRSKENKLNPEHGTTRRKRNDAQFPWTCEFPEQIFT